MRSTTKSIFTNQSLAANATSSPIISLDQMYGFCIQATVAGSTFAGSYQIQGSCDPGNSPDGAGVTNWFPVGTAVTISAAGVTGTNFDAVYYRWLRVVFTATTGVGTLNMVVSFKGP